MGAIKLDGFTTIDESTEPTNRIPDTLLSLAELLRKAGIPAVFTQSSFFDRNTKYNHHLWVFDADVAAAKAFQNGTHPDMVHVGYIQEDHDGGPDIIGVFEDKDEAQREADTAARNTDFRKSAYVETTVLVKRKGAGR